MSFVPRAIPGVVARGQQQTTRCREEKSPQDRVFIRDELGRKGAVRCAAPAMPRQATHPRAAEGVGPNVAGFVVEPKARRCALHPGQIGPIALLNEGSPCNQYNTDDKICEQNHANKDTGNMIKQTRLRVRLKEAVQILSDCSPHPCRTVTRTTQLYTTSATQAQPVQAHGWCKTARNMIPFILRLLAVVDVVTVLSLQCFDSPLI